MSKFTDRDYLVSDQYKNASNLDARIRLHQCFSTNHYGWTSWIFDRLQLGSESGILELGCGSGNLWLDNLDRIPDGWEMTLSDLSPGMLAEARDNLGKAGRPFRFQVMDAQAIPFETGSFDAIVANNMLYHVPDRPWALFEIHRVLRPGGRLFAATNGRDHLREIRELVSTLDPEADLTSAAAEFGLENGMDQLSQFFAHVSCHRYEDGLMVTEAEPLVAYILSSRRSRVVEENPQALVRLIESRMESGGAIFITKDAGLFEAIKDSLLETGTADECVDSTTRCPPYARPSSLNPLPKAPYSLCRVRTTSRHRQTQSAVASPRLVLPAPSASRAHFGCRNRPVDLGTPAPSACVPGWWSALHAIPPSTDDVGPSTSARQ